MKKVFIIIGAPCVGKGTQSRLLKSKEFIHLSAGDLLREEYPVGTPTRTLLDSGNMVDVSIINTVIGERIMREKGNNVILDGYPRTKEQAIFLKDFCFMNKMKLCAAIILFAKKSILLDRMNKRTICSKCQCTYSEHTLCCNEHTYKRADDQDVNIFAKRHRTFINSLYHILECIECPSYWINGNNSKKHINERILSILNY